MADHSDMRFKAGEAAGHAQTKKDEIMNKARGTADSCKQSCQESTERAGGFMQQAGEQAKSMTQGAADAVKNAVGMGGNTTTTTNTKTTTTKY